jgi:hypothetical protein
MASRVMAFVRARLDGGTVLDEVGYMPYKVIVERMDGTRIELPDIHHRATPQIGTTVEVEIEMRTARVVVDNISSIPPKSPGAVTVDSVTTREIG